MEICFFSFLIFQRYFKGDIYHAAAAHPLDFLWFVLLRLQYFLRRTVLGLFFDLLFLFPPPVVSLGDGVGDGEGDGVGGVVDDGVGDVGGVVDLFPNIDKDVPIIYIARKFVYQRSREGPCSTRVKCIDCTPRTIGSKS